MVHQYCRVSNSGGSIGRRAKPSAPLFFIAGFLVCHVSQYFTPRTCQNFSQIPLQQHETQLSAAATVGDGAASSRRFLMVKQPAHLVHVLSDSANGDAPDPERIKNKARAPAQQGVEAGATEGGNGTGDGASGPSPNIYQHRLRAWQQQLAGLSGGLSKWAPLVLTKCELGMPQHWAPCLKVPQAEVLAAHELVYPAVEVLLPRFASDGHREWFLYHPGISSWQHHITITRDKGGMRHQYAALQTNNGQMWVFGNTRYTDDPFPDAWNGPEWSMCLGHRMRVRQFTRAAGPSPGDLEHEELVLYNGPDASRFQHHIDHATKLVSSSAYMVDLNTDILITRSAGIQPTVTQMWDWMTHLNHSRYSVAQNTNHFAKRLVVPCRTPLAHPYILQLSQILSLGPQSRLVPLAERKVVLFMSRNGVDSQRSLSRKLLNEEKLLAALQEALKARQQGEELVVVSNMDSWPVYRGFAEYVNKQARAIIGPHGGLMENIRWLAPNATVVEIASRGYWAVNFWHDSVCLGLQYSQLSYPDANSEHDIHVNTTEVVDLLLQTLGKEPAADLPVIRHHYEWEEALLMAGEVGYVG